MCAQYMVTPTKGDDAFNFEQSSNRMAIECCFGMIVRRWGILWRKLEMRFDKRTAVIGCCIRLHNFCLDRKLEVELQEHEGETLVQPDQWRETPVFDSDGRPVDYLKNHFSKRGKAATGVSTTAQRESLQTRISELGLLRPVRRGRGGQ